jgi:anti-sigma B factor antagonist
VDLGFAQHSAEGWTVLAISGEIDIATAPKVFAVVHQVIEGEGISRLLLDFSGVAFLDAAGVSALVRAHKILVERGERLRLTGLRPHVARVLRITGVATVFDIVPGLDITRLDLADLDAVRIAGHDAARSAGQETTGHRDAGGTGESGQ